MWSARFFENVTSKDLFTLIEKHVYYFLKVERKIQSDLCLINLLIEWIVVCIAQSLFRYSIGTKNDQLWDNCIFSLIFTQEFLEENQKNSISYIDIKATVIFGINSSSAYPCIEAND